MKTIYVTKISLNQLDALTAAGYTVIIKHGATKYTPPKKWVTVTYTYGNETISN